MTNMSHTTTVLNVHIDPKFLHISKIIQPKMNNMPLKFQTCLICKLVHMHMRHISMYALYEPTAIKCVTGSTGIHIFHIIGTCPSTNMAAICIHIFH